VYDRSSPGRKKLPQYLHCVQRRCLFPLFFVCVTLAFLFAIAFLIVSLVLADSCANDPSENILAAAEYYMVDGLGADIDMGFLKFWLSRCNNKPPLMIEHEAFLEGAQAILQEINDAILNITDGVSKFCGTTDPNLFADIIATSVTYLCGVICLLVEVGKAFRCSSWMPLYYNTVYDALCYNGIDGIWSIAVTQFTTVLMACIIY